MTVNTQETRLATGMQTIRIGTSASGVAMARARGAGEKINRLTGNEIELVTLAGIADGSSSGSSEDTAALRGALLTNECDLVVHSLRNVPIQLHPGIVIGAVPEREDARDALCAIDGRALAQLPAGSRVGVDSARRVAQLAASRDDLDAVIVPGTVQTRLSMMKRGQLEAIVMDASNVSRLGLDDEVTEFFELSAWPTTPGQGAMAFEVRADDARNISAMRAMLTKLDHRATRAATTAERVVLDRLTGCAAPLGASAMNDSGLLLLSGTVYRPDGGAQITSSHGVVLDGMSPAEAKVAVEALGRTVANELLRQGAAELAPLGSDS